MVLVSDILRTSTDDRGPPEGISAEFLRGGEAVMRPWAIWGYSGWLGRTGGGLKSNEFESTQSDSLASSWVRMGTLAPRRRCPTPPRSSGNPPTAEEEEEGTSVEWRGMAAMEWCLLSLIRVWIPKFLREELELERGSSAEPGGMATEQGRRLESVELLGAWFTRSFESYEYCRVPLSNTPSAITP